MFNACENFDMALFVHLAPETQSASIRRSGIKPRRVLDDDGKVAQRIVFAMPVTSDFYISHQWLRELKRRGARTLVGVYFRLPDDQPVSVGHYGRNHLETTASEAAGLLIHLQSAEGYEVLIPRKVQAKEIHDIRPLPQVLGWRYYPNAHGHAPCGCPVCQPRGEIKSRRLRDSYNDSEG
jgi:hypothetical protein